jgi:hypothetical protein
MDWIRKQSLNSWNSVFRMAQFSKSPTKALLHIRTQTTLGDLHQLNRALFLSQPRVLEDHIMIYAMWIGINF